MKDLGGTSEVKNFKQALQSEATNFIRPLLLKLD